MTEQQCKAFTKLGSNSKTMSSHHNLMTAQDFASKRILSIAFGKCLRVGFGYLTGTNELHFEIVHEDNSKRITRSRGLLEMEKIAASLRERVEGLGASCGEKIYITWTRHWQAQDCQQIIEKALPNKEIVVIPAIQALVAGVFQEPPHRSAIIIVDLGRGTMWAVVDGTNIVGKGDTPAGSDHIVSDLSIGLKIPLREAEALMRDTRNLIASGNPEDSPETIGSCISEIAVARMAELLEVPRNQITPSKLLPNTEAQVLLASDMWGINQFDAFAAKTFGCPVQNLSSFMPQEANRETEWMLWYGLLRIGLGATPFC